MIPRALSVALFLTISSTLIAQTTPPLTSPGFELASYNLHRDSYLDAIVPGDFNNDGKLDLIVQGGLGPVGSPGSSEYGLTLLLGNGDGSFQPPVVIGSTSTLISSMAVADFNHDGNLDLITFNSSSAFDIFYGNGHGSFQAPLRVATAAPIASGTIGTFFDDGYTDVAIADTNGDLELFKNEGGSSFVERNAITAVAPSSPNFVIQAGDLNATGASDIAVLTSTSAYVLWNTGQGNFTKVLLANYAHPVALNFNDLNQDGRSDILLTYSCNNSNPQSGNTSPTNCAGIDVYYGQGNNTTLFHHLVTNSGPTSPQNIFAADVNGDGIADLVASSTGTSTSPTSTGSSGLYLWLGNPDGSFAQTPVIYNSGTFGGLAPGDFNRNGLISFAQYDSSGLQLYLAATPLGGPCQTSTVSPSVTACQPLDNTYLPSTSSVLVNATTYDKNHVTAIQQYIDGQLAASHSASTLSESFPPLAPGPHHLVTKAWDYTGLSFRTDRNLIVFSGTPTSACPAALGTAALCFPATTSGATRILGNGWTPNVPTAAQLYIDGKLILNNTNPGTTYLDTTPTLTPGTHNIVFKLWDAAGKVYTAQSTHTTN